MRRALRLARRLSLAAAIVLATVFSGTVAAGTHLRLSPYLMIQALINFEGLVF